MTEAEKRELREIARAVAENVPSRHDPERFHVNKSDIAYRLRRLARQEGKA